jgi:hypothetical protein
MRPRCASIRGMRFSIGTAGGSLRGATRRRPPLIAAEWRLHGGGATAHFCMDRAFPWRRGSFLARPCRRPQRPCSFPGRLFAVQSFARHAPCRLCRHPFRPRFARKPGSPATAGPGTPANVLIFGPSVKAGGRVAPAPAITRPAAQPINRRSGELVRSRSSRAPMAHRHFQTVGIGQMMNRLAVRRTGRRH